MQAMRDIFSTDDIDTPYKQRLINDNKDDDDKYDVFDDNDDDKAGSRDIIPNGRFLWWVA